MIRYYQIMIILVTYRNSFVLAGIRIDSIHGMITIGIYIYYIIIIIQSCKALKKSPFRIKVWIENMQNDLKSLCFIS